MKRYYAFASLQVFAMLFYGYMAIFERDPSALLWVIACLTLAVAFLKDAYLSIAKIIDHDRA
jgi:hypothetical protein